MATIAVDFDGVLHAYSRGWQDGSIYDGPVEGSKPAMRTLLDMGFNVVIYSTRCYDRKVDGKVQKAQVQEMADWLKRYEIPYSKIHTEPGKPLCRLFIDDNAYRFTGEWTQVFTDLGEKLESWKRKP